MLGAKVIEDLYNYKIIKLSIKLAQHDPRTLVHM